MASLARAQRLGVLPSDKILKIDALGRKLAQTKLDGSKVVLCHGVFDLMHIGHIRHFQEAREFGDLLVVTVTPDRYVNKGTHRPAFPESLRAEAVASLAAVDFVAVNDWPTAIETIGLLRPDIYCKGGEFQGTDDRVPQGLQLEIRAVEEIGGRVEYTSENLSSSSFLINSYLDVFPDEASRWLQEFRKRWSIEDLYSYLEGAEDLRVMVIGEALLEEYVFCDGLGRSSKDPLLAFQYRYGETYVGGSLAVANHLAGFCRDVCLVTQIGEIEREEAFIRGSLLPNVYPHFLTRPGAPTIHKRRFTDTHTGSRVFELYHMDDTPLGPDEEASLVEALCSLGDGYDLVVVVDNGFGLMTDGVIRHVCNAAKYLAVGTQANAGNRGFNTISKYPRADYVCLAMREVMLETRMRHAEWDDLVMEVVQRIDCEEFTVTWGQKGSLHYSAEQEFIKVPSLATKVVDRLGAGDAVLAVTPLLVVQDAPRDVVGFVGNLAGAQMVGEIGSRKLVSRDSIATHAKSLLK